MVFLSFLNLGLAFLYYIFATYMAVPVGWAVPGGVVLFVSIFSLNQVLEKSGSLIWLILGVVVVAVTTCLVTYSLVSMGESSSLGVFTAFLSGLTVVTVFGAVFSIVSFLIGEDSEDMFMFGVICFYVALISATLANSVLLASVFHGMLFA